MILNILSLFPKYLGVEDELSNLLQTETNTEIDSMWKKGGRLWINKTACRYIENIAKILNKQSQTADNGWSTSLGVRREPNNSST
jgi:hypothetical protein